MGRTWRWLGLWLADAVLAAAVVYAFYFLRYADAEAWAREVMRYAPHALLFAGALTLAVAACGGYEPRVVRSGSLTLSRLVVASGLALLALAFVGFLLRDLLLWRSAVLPALGLSAALLWLVRVVFSRLHVAPAVARRVAAIGDEPFLSRLRAIAAEGTFLLTEARALAEVSELDADAAHAFADRLAAAGVDELVVAARDRRGRLPLELLMRARLRGIRVTDYAEVFERETGRVDLDAVRPGWFVFSDGFEGTRLEHFAKRLFDLCAALTLLVLTAPLVALACLAIWLEDGRPVFHVQERVGLGGVPFRLIKLRTMRKDAEKDGPRYAAENDPRITRVGRILRRFRIDELPQLLHVLAGEMSFVGPRPERPEFVRELSRVLPWFEQRHRVKPGLAGWAQLNAPYAADIETARLKLEYDLYYLKHWSLAFDLAILLRTFQVVVWGNGVR